MSSSVASQAISVVCETFWPWYETSEASKYLGRSSASVMAGQWVWCGAS